MCGLILLLLSLFWLERETLGIQFVPNNALPNGTLCDGYPTQSSAGMFGQSLALTVINSTNSTLLFVGKPWDCSVSIFKGTVQYNTVTFNVPTPGSNSTSSTSSASSTATTTASSYTPPLTLPQLVSPSRTVNVIKNVVWKKNQMLVDDSNGTWANQAYSLFGYSVAVTPDGSYLAVGIPAKNRDISCSNNNCLENNRFDGAIRIFKQNSAGSYVPQTVNQPANSPVVRGSLSNAASPDLFLSNQIYWDKFGTKVTFSNDPNNTFLFASTCAGWDGAPVNNLSTYETYNDPLFPRTQTNSTTNLGVVVLRKDSNGNYMGTQFLHCKSPMPFGTIGVDMTVTGDRIEHLVLAVRDRIPNNISSMAFSVPGVVLYRYDPVSQLFKEDGFITNQYNYAGVQYYYKNEDWFGVGMTLSSYYERLRQVVAANVTDPNNSSNIIPGAVVVETQGNNLRYVLTVGAPFEGQVVYVYSANVSNASFPAVPLSPSPVGFSTFPWNVTQYLPNNYDTLRTYFGGKQGVTNSGRFMIVTDGTSSSGRGTAQLYYRRDDYEDIYGYENVVKVIIDPTVTPVYYDRVGQLIKPADYYASARSQPYYADHFGVGLAMNEQLAVIGAPAEECVYSFALPPPYFINRTIPIPPNINNTITASIPVATATGVLVPLQDGNMINVSTGDAIKYGIIGGSCGGILLIPLIWYMVKYFHKRKHLRKLEQYVANQEKN